MQAIILAGGYGTRLYPLTLNAPKPMIPVAGKPMIEYLITTLEKIPEIHEIFIVSNEKFAHVFEEWLRDSSPKTPITIVNDGTISNEDRLGSLGDIQYVLDHYTIDEDLLIVGGDNLFEDDFSGILESFKTRGNTIGLYDVGNLEYVRQLSNPTLDETGRVIAFVEKPEHPTSTLCSTLVYALRRSDLEHITPVIASGKSDRAGDFIAHLCTQVPVYGTTLEGQWFDIGTLEQLERANAWVVSLVSPE